MSRAIDGLGLFSLEAGVISARHVVHTTEGKVIGEWGVRNLAASEVKTSPKRTNVPIARQSLRLALLEQLLKVIQIRHRKDSVVEPDLGNLSPLNGIPGFK